MRKVFYSFVFMLLLCMMFSLNVQATVTTSDYRIFADTKDSLSYAFVDNNPSSKSFFVFIEDVDTLIYLSLDECHSYYAMKVPLSATSSYTFSDGYRYTTSYYNDILTIKGIDYRLPYGICRSLFTKSYAAVYTDVRYKNMEEFIAALTNAGNYTSYMNSDFSGGGDNDNKLPMLHYKMSSKNVISFPNIIDKKISIDWDFSSVEPYASDPMAYALEIIISANFYPNTEGQKICWDASNSGINNDCKRYLDTQASLLNKPFSFIYLKEGDALYTSSNHIFATDELQDGYYLYIRSYSKDGTKSSNYKVYKCTTGGTSGQMDLTYDTEGNSYALDDDDRDDNSDYSNEYDENSSSSADETPTGDSYDGNGGYSFDTLYGNLNSMVNMLQGVPELWVYVMSWLPSWFPTFIVTMMGLLIVIGVLKYIF